MEKPLKIKILEQILRIMAKAVLIKYKPTVIGITGSVGKTSAKEAVFAALSEKFLVRKNEKNYNNEIGIPLTILGVETGGRHINKWMKIFLHWLGMLLKKDEYPQVLVIEMGVDRPGDMDYLLTFVKPKIGIVTNISGSHLEFFGTLDNIAKEKGKLIESLSEDGFAILNADDARCAKMSQRTKAYVLSAGFSEGAVVHASNCVYHYDEKLPDGISFKLSYEGKTIPVRLAGILAQHQVNAALFGIAAGIALKVNLVDIAKGMEKFVSPLGRLNMIAGKNESLIVDDTYNASPTSTIAALAVLGELKTSGRKIAVLGDMLELGDGEQQGHRDVCSAAGANGVDLFIGVGRRMKEAMSVLAQQGYEKEKMFHFENPDAAGEKLSELIFSGDIVLVKGSQGMRMEKVVEKVIANKEDAEKKISRQSLEWKARPFMNP